MEIFIGGNFLHIQRASVDYDVASKAINIPPMYGTGSGSLSVNMEIAGRYCNIIIIETIETKGSAIHQDDMGVAAVKNNIPHFNGIIHHIPASFET